MQLYMVTQLKNLGVNIDDNDIDEDNLELLNYASQLDANIDGVYKDEYSTFYTFHTVMAGANSDLSYTYADLMEALNHEHNEGNGDDSGNDGPTDPELKEIPASICPAGWKLPSYVKMKYMLSLYEDSSSTLGSGGPKMTTTPFAEGSFAGLRGATVDNDNPSEVRIETEGVGRVSYYWLSTYTGSGTNAVSTLAYFGTVSEGGGTSMKYGTVFGVPVYYFPGEGISVSARCMTGTAEPPEDFDPGSMDVD